MELIYQKMDKVAEEFFGTNNDPDQIPINEDSNRKLREIHNDTIMYKTDQNGDPISWIVVIPTSLDTMNKFLKKEITERQLLDIANKEKSFEALYLCSAFTLPSYRNKGLTKELILDAIQKFAPNSSNEICAWPYSPEGKNLIKFIERELKRKITLYKE